MLQRILKEERSRRTWKSEKISKWKVRAGERWRKNGNAKMDLEKVTAGHEMQLSLLEEEQAIVASWNISKKRRRLIQEYAEISRNKEKDSSNAHSQEEVTGKDDKSPREEGSS